ncbi:MAG: hypothetical protein MJ109_01215 [Kiritimatiellae bacterium]|nr:hypothetical protein [Kiritimatiellia bacterium]
MRNSFYKVSLCATIAFVAMFVAQAQVLSLNGKNGQTITSGGTYDGIEYTDKTAVYVTLSGGTWSLGDKGIRVRTAQSELTLENCTLGSTANWAQYMKVGGLGSDSNSTFKYYNTSKIKINGTLTINTDHTIILSRLIAGDNNPTIVVKGAGKVIMIPSSVGDTYEGIALPPESEHFHVANRSLVISAK